jgi:hypothetical protein
VRNPVVRTLEEFRKLDQEQWSFGLLRVAEEFADVRVVNEESLEEYYRKIGSIIAGAARQLTHGVSRTVHPKHDADENQLYRCLAALESAGRPLTCDEIEEQTQRFGKTILHNNANKVLKRVPELARRLELEGTRVRYEILNPGRAYVRLMKGYSRQTRDGQGKGKKARSHGQ